MPQLKKLSVPPSNILPKGNLKVNQSYGYSNESMFSPSYLALLIEEERSQSLTSEPESDVSDSVQNRPRKRQRLDHLSQEEKVMRRKLKNRVAAQTARDRKKAKMQELEDQVSLLVAEKRLLVLKTLEHVNKIRALEQENSELKLRLGVTTDCSNPPKVKTESECSKHESSTLSVDSRSLEQAEGTGSADSFNLDDAVRLLASNSETDDLLDLLRQCGEGLMECDFTDTHSDSSEARKQITCSSEVVGPTSKSLESNKELIHFDHIYSKQDDSCSLSLPDGELSTKDSHIPQTLLTSDIDLDGIVEIVDSSSNIPTISIPSNPSDSQLDDDVLSFECDTFSFGEMSEHLLCPPSSDELKHCSSPSSSSDAGYDSSFSASSPCGDAGNPWDDTLTELFPSLV